MNSGLDTADLMRMDPDSNWQNNGQTNGDIEPFIVLDGAGDKRGEG